MADLARQPLPETRHCEVVRVLYQNATGFVVAQVASEARPQDRYVVAGACEAPRVGAQWEVTGRVTPHAKYGPQFKADSIIEHLPATRDALEKYLGSGVIAGIGPVTAAALMRVFGEQVIIVLDTAPQRLRELPGIGEKKAARIQAGWEQTRATYHIMRFLREMGLGPALAARVHKSMGGGSGEDIIRRLRANPYLLSRVRGIGFPTTDRCALTLGIDRSAPQRIAAGIRDALDTAVIQGHTAMATQELVVAVSALLGLAGEEVSPVLKVLCDRAKLRRCVLENTECVALPALLLAEQRIAQSLLTRLRPDAPLAHQEALRRVDRSGLGPSQAAAIDRMGCAPITVLTGGPGMGKTTLIKTVVAAYRAAGRRVTLCAPTGRATRRLQEATGHEAATIHRTLEVTHGNTFQRNVSNPLETDLVIVDEASMVDVLLFSALLEALPLHACLLVVGDSDQLPSVGPGAVLADLIASGQVPVARLTEIYRQAAGSAIPVAAHDLLTGQMPAPSDDVRFVAMAVDDTAQVVTVVTDLIASGTPPEAIQVLAPMKRGAAGTAALNEALREALNPSSPQKQEIATPGGRFRVGDRLLQGRNNYTHELYNGDVGRIVAINRVEDEDQIQVTFEDRVIALRREDLDDMRLAYALTVHKAQGGEYPVVVLIVSTAHYPLLSVPLLYTGVTRARQCVVFIGTRKALGIGLRQKQQGRRKTALKTYLQENLRGEYEHRSRNNKGPVS